MLRAVRDPLAWTHAMDAGEQYVKQINAWVRIAKTKPQDGSTYYAWIQRGKHDHYHDCEKMQIVCAAMAGIVGHSRAAEE